MKPDINADEQSTNSSPGSVSAKSADNRRGSRFRRFVTTTLVLLASAVAVFKIWQIAAVPDDAPLIGVSYDTAWHAAAGITTKNYEIALTRTGGRILQLDPVHDDLETVLNRIDSLLLTGGGEESAELIDRRRDDFELELIRGAVERDMPILGICRGIQIINVAYGGTLRSIREDPQLAETHGIGLASFTAHPVEIVPGSKLAEMLGAGTIKVNSFHGQAVGRPGQELRVVAKSPDGVIEALEFRGKRFVVCIQWHPEVPPAQMEVFREFLRQADWYRERKRK